jgi:2-polyprenyl-6-methoxyphenol hydroxylase-like FAD-dependent oxidoreductase
VVANAVHAAKYNTRPSTACAYYSYWRGGPNVTDFENYVRPSLGGACLPTNDGLTRVVGGWKESFAQKGERPADTYRRMLNMIPRLSEFPREAEQVGTVKGIREIPGYFREACGEGWALAGDAGYHKHPLSAQGITDAFRDADLLCSALDEGFSGRDDMADALEEYERLRDAAVTPIYQSTCERARLEPPSNEALALFRALRTNQREADRFFGTDAGTVPAAEFFAPENLGRIVQLAPSAAAKSG